MLQVRWLAKRYGDVVALDGCSLRCAMGGSPASWDSTVRQDDDDADVPEARYVDSVVAADGPRSNALAVGGRAASLAAPDARLLGCGDMPRHIRVAADRWW